MDADLPGNCYTNLDNSWMNDWKLSDEVSMLHAVLLLLDLRPDLWEKSCISDCSLHSRPPRFAAMQSAIIAAVNNGSLAAKKTSMDMAPFYKASWIEKDVFKKTVYDWTTSMISLKDLMIWAKSKQYQCEFLFPTVNPEAHTLGGTHYAYKLALGNAAWLAVVNDPTLAKNKSVKQAIVQWIKANAGPYLPPEIELLDGVIEQIAVVANFCPKGGAPKTG